VPGSVRQLRGPEGSHVHEFPDRWVLHRDIADAEADPLGHLLSDAPEYLVSAIAGLATALVANKKRDGRNALLTGWSMTAFLLLLGKMGKAIGEDDSEKEVKAPRLVYPEGGASRSEPGGSP